MDSTFDVLKDFILANPDMGFIDKNYITSKIPMTDEEFRDNCFALKEEGLLIPLYFFACHDCSIAFGGKPVTKGIPKKLKCPLCHKDIEVSKDTLIINYFINRKPRKRRKKKSTT